LCQGATRGPGADPAAIGDRLEKLTTGFPDVPGDREKRQPHALIPVHRDECTAKAIASALTLFIKIHRIDEESMRHE